MRSVQQVLRKLSIVCSFVVLSASVDAQDYTVTDFGAKADDKTDNSKAIQKAIDKAAINGGTVIIPGGGVYLSGTIILKSNVTLKVEKNATLKGMAKSEAYPPQPITYPLLSGSGQFGNALIYASKAENITITGQGTIDGNGGDPVFHFVEGQKSHVRRPYVLLIESCRYVTVSDITLQSSAMWMQRYIACDFLRIKSINVFNHVNPNNDGTDIDDCHDVVVSDCIIDADDDALCFKSEGARGVKNVVVTNCILSSHASAFKLGTGSIGGFQSIQFSNSIIRPSRATNLVHIFKQKGGLTGIDMASVDGGLLKDINIQNISIDSVQNPI
ncbi:MAG: polygalacturonase, partial [Chitinophagaceae bacterium]|nr:polygalacturonase [Chitinophagaceae bacterium]